jgi:hypothetical protein
VESIFLFSLAFLIVLQHQIVCQVFFFVKTVFFFFFFVVVVVVCSCGDVEPGPPGAVPQPKCFLNPASVFGPFIYFCTRALGREKRRKEQRRHSVAAPIRMCRPSRVCVCVYVWEDDGRINDV